MADLINNMLHFALWAFFVIFAFAAVGVIVTVRWIVHTFTRSRDAVASGIDSAERAIHLK